jgi:hypothetical protein
MPDSESAEATAEFKAELGIKLCDAAAAGNLVQVSHLQCSESATSCRRVTRLPLALVPSLPPSQLRRLVQLTLALCRLSCAASF